MLKPDVLIQRALFHHRSQTGSAKFEYLADAWQILIRFDEMAEQTCSVNWEINSNITSLIMSYSNHACIFVKYVLGIFPWPSLQHCEVADKPHACSHLSAAFVLQFRIPFDS